MLNSINIVLTGIAISDIITMVDYIPYVVHFYVMTDIGDTPRKIHLSVVPFLSGAHKTEFSHPFHKANKKYMCVSGFPTLTRFLARP